MINGYIIRRIGLDRNNSLKLKRVLFGIVAKTKDGFYYYPGFYDNKYFVMLARGCEFVTEVPSSFETDFGAVFVIPAQLDEEKFNQLKITGREYWRNIARNKYTEKVSGL